MLSADITTSEGEVSVLAVAISTALVTSEVLSGDPLTIVRLAFWLDGRDDVRVASEGGVRARAMTLCPRLSASRRTRLPVRPVEPRMMICIVVV